MTLTFIQILISLILRETKFQEIKKIKKIQIQKFKNYEEEEEAAFWDELDTTPFMEDDGKWFRFDTPTKRAIRVAILPEIAEKLVR